MMDELILLSKDILETIAREDREFEFKINKGYVERTVASKFKNVLKGD